MGVGWQWLRACIGWHWHWRHGAITTGCMDVVGAVLQTWRRRLSSTRNKTLTQHAARWRWPPPATEAAPGGRQEGLSCPPQQLLLCSLQHRLL